MDKVKNKGFVSNVYVVVNTIITISFLLFFLILFWFDKNKISFPVYMALLLALGTVINFLLYLNAASAYRTYEINNLGIRCGKIRIKFENIEKVSICRGYVEEYFGFSFFERLTGVSQHNEIYVEEMICINCDFEPLNSKKSKKCVYIPKNKKTDALMRKYCKKYEQVKKESDKREKAQTNREIKSRIIMLAFVTLFFVFIITLLAMNGFLNVYKAILLSVVGLLLLFLLSFKPFVTCFFASEISGENLKATK